MIPKETLKDHYKEYARKPDGWVENMAATKGSIVGRVLREANFQAGEGPVKIVVLGASDPRYLKIHQKIFRDEIQRVIEMKTFDIDTNHLGGESPTVVEHDVTNPFLDANYAIVFSHELMKFLKPEEQLAAIKNSYNALGENGLAMHIIHSPSIERTAELKSWQHGVDPDDIIEKLKSEGIPAEKLIFKSDSQVDWLQDTTVIVLKKANQ